MSINFHPKRSLACGIAGLQSWGHELQLFKPNPEFREVGGLSTFHVLWELLDFVVYSPEWHLRLGFPSILSVLCSPWTIINGCAITVASIPVANTFLCISLQQCDWKIHLNKESEWIQTNMINSEYIYICIHTCTYTFRKYVYVSITLFISLSVFCVSLKL